MRWIIWHGLFAYNTMAKYIKLSVEVVERRTLEASSNQNAVVFDAWTVGSLQHIAVFATLTFINAVGYKQVLQGFQPFKNEGTQDDMEYFSDVSYALEIQSTVFNSLATLISDNTNFNKETVKRTTMPLVWCANRRFNLAVYKLQIIRTISSVY